MRIQIRIQDNTDWKHCKRGPNLFVWHMYFQASEVCLAAGIGMFGLARIVYCFYEEKRTGFYSNKPYKRYYTVIR